MTSRPSAEDAKAVGKEIEASRPRSVADALAKQRIDMDSLAGDLKQELKAKETKIIAFDGIYKDLSEIILMAAAGGTTNETLKSIKRLAAKGSVRILGASGEKTLVAIDMVNWGVRQKARMDAQKLLDMYPVETKKIQLDEGTLSAILTGLPPGLSEAVRAELSRIVSEKRD